MEQKDLNTKLLLLLGYCKVHSDYISRPFLLAAVYTADNSITGMLNLVLYDKAVLYQASLTTYTVTAYIHTQLQIIPQPLQLSLPISLLLPLPPQP